MRVLVVYGLLTALALLSAAALTSAGAYRAPVFSVLLGNAMSLLVLLLADRGAPIGVAARAMTAGAAATLLCLVPSLARLGFLGGWSRSAPELPWRKATVLLLSLAAAGAVDLLERPFASMTGPGSLALLAFASKLIHLPMRLIAAPLASVAFPLFVKSREKSPSSPAGETAHTTRWIVDLLFYSAAVTAGAAGPIVALTFGRGRFDSAAVSALSHVVALLAPAVVAIGAIEVASKLLLASDRASLVVVAQVLGLAVYAVAAPLLRSYGVSGLALARDLSWCTAAGILTIALARHQKDLGLTAGFARALIPCGAALGIATLATRMLPGGAILRGAAAASLAALVFFGLLAVSFLLVGRYAEGGVRPQ
jgi:putative peptidoglycan lipid II flippase